MVFGQKQAAVKVMAVQKILSFPSKELQHITHIEELQNAHIDFNRIRTGTHYQNRHI